MWRDSELFRSLREPQSAGACASCGSYDACQGGCMAAKFFTGLPLDGPDPECVNGHGEALLAGVAAGAAPVPSGDHSKPGSSPVTFLRRKRRLDRLSPGTSEGRRGVEPRVNTGRQKLLLAVASVVVVVAVAVLGSLAGWVSNPFSSPDDVEIDTASALIELRDLADYHAASGTFEVVVESDQDADYLPDLVKGRSTTMRVAGSVDAVVDFSELSAGAIVVDPDDPTAVTVTLPGAYLSDPQLDHERTEVLSRERGVFDRIGDAISGDPANDEALYRMGEDELRRLATETELQERGRGQHPPDARGHAREPRLRAGDHPLRGSSPLTHR